MIANALTAYQSALQKLSEIENRAAAADTYCMRLVLANSRGALVPNITTDLLPIGTPFEDFYTSAGLVSVFSQFMDDVAIMSGAEATVALAPNAKEAMLLSLPRQFVSIRALMDAAMVDAQGYSGLHVPLADTSSLADNIATLINGIGYQFAWPICLGSFRNSVKINSLQAVATSGSNGVVLSNVLGNPVFGSSGMSDWNKPRSGDSFLISDISALTVFDTPLEYGTVAAVDVDFESITLAVGEDTASADETAIVTASRNEESLGTLYFRKVLTA